MSLTCPACLPWVAPCLLSGCRTVPTLTALFLSTGGFGAPAVSVPLCLGWGSLRTGWAGLRPHCCLSVLSPRGHRPWSSPLAGTTDPSLTHHCPQLRVQASLPARTRRSSREHCEAARGLGAVQRPFWVPRGGLTVAAEEPSAPGTRRSQAMLATTQSCLLRRGSH